MAWRKVSRTWVNVYVTTGVNIDYTQWFIYWPKSNWKLWHAIPAASLWQTAGYLMLCSCLSCKQSIWTCPLGEMMVKHKHLTIWQRKPCFPCSSLGFKSLFLLWLDRLLDDVIVSPNRATHTPKDGWHKPRKSSSPAWAFGKLDPYTFQLPTSTLV